jgi:hypothetical protein
MKVFQIHSLFLMFDQKAGVFVTLFLSFNIQVLYLALCGALWVFISTHKHLLLKYLTVLNIFYGQSPAFC